MGAGDLAATSAGIAQLRALQAQVSKVTHALSKKESSEDTARLAVELSGPSENTITMLTNTSGLHAHHLKEAAAGRLQELTTLWNSQDFVKAWMAEPDTANKKTPWEDMVALAEKSGLAAVTEEETKRLAANCDVIDEDTNMVKKKKKKRK